MEFFLTDQDVERLPPADIRLLDLCADPYPDVKHLRVVLDPTPFQQKPYLALTLTDSPGEVVATASIVETVTWRFELTLHNPKPGTTAGGVFKLAVILSLPGLGEIDHRDLTIEIPSPLV
jgi:hypothetical protein